MGIKTAYTKETDTGKAVSDIKSQIGDFPSKLVLFFASSIYDPVSLSAGMQSAFGGAATLGCSTAGEIITGKMLKNSLVAMAMDSGIIGDFKVLIMSKIKEGNPVKDSF